MTDKKKIEDAADLIYELMRLNQNIESPIWCAAVVSVLVHGYKNSGFSYHYFRKKMDEAFDHHEKLWDENDV